MSIKEAFAGITKWQDEKFPDATGNAALIKLEEESLEFGAAAYDLMNAVNPSYRYAKQETALQRVEKIERLKKSTGMELIDMMYCLNNFANKMGIDLDVAAANVKEKNDKRKWKKAEDGTYSHVKT